VVEEILETGTEKINNEDIVQTLLTEVIDIGNTS
jgi:hypothetical protein